VHGSVRGYYSFEKGESSVDILMSGREGYGSRRVKRCYRDLHNINP
jgi:hypothetical protein